MKLIQTLWNEWNIFCRRVLMTFGAGGFVIPKQFVSTDFKAFFRIDIGNFDRRTPIRTWQWSLVYRGSSSGSNGLVWNLPDPQKGRASQVKNKTINRKYILYYYYLGESPRFSDAMEKSSSAIYTPSRSATESLSPTA